uniref:Uncharacterized protein n=1 Tax=Brassica oleracea var. oleracea TaxID=109376 RepID=A0A0D3DF27_BRAOL
MENQEVSCDVDDDELSLNHIVDEEDFRSCCGDDEQMFFKGVSITERGDSSSGHSGIGVVLERSGEDFELIQITNEEKLETPILVALRERVLEKTSSLDGFVLKLAPLCDLHQALTLARVAVEFCYCCGGEYREGQQSCTCAFWDDEEEEDQEDTIQELEQWPWDTFNSMPSVMDAYSEQERSQLALIQRFLAAGGFNLTTLLISPRLNVESHRMLKLL